MSRVTTVMPRAAVSAAFADTWQRNLRAASAATLASLVLVTSPMAAHAKGGGHGGGGHHSSHSSSSHSSSSSLRTLHSYHGVTRSSRASGSSSGSSRSRQRTSGSSSSRTHYSSTAASPPPPALLYPDKSAARRENGYYCPANLPRPGERVYIEQEDKGLPKRKATVVSAQPASQTTLYGSGGGVLQPVPGFESDCSVLVRYDDGMVDTVSAAEQPVPAAVEFAENALLGTAMVGYGALMFTDGGDSAWDSATGRRDELLDEIVAVRLPPLARPVSGEYWGASDESDEGDQAVRTTLTFNCDGTITGRGVDGVDGSYRVTRGRWGVLRDQRDTSKLTVTWTEMYDEGFEVVVEGRYDESTAHIKADFTSSRGIRGRFELRPKPSVF